MTQRHIVHGDETQYAAILDVGPILTHRQLSGIYVHRYSTMIICASEVSLDGDDQLVHAPGERAPDGLRAAILAILEREGPVGQGTISLELRRSGIELSVPTIGRRLQALEFEGLVTKAGVRGRVLTDRGRQVLNDLHAEEVLRVPGTALLRTLTRGDKKHLLDMLFVRRILERASAALAARHADHQTIARLEQLLGQQVASIGRGELGVQEDVKYHLEIARASGNPVLASLVALLRQHHRYNLAITSIRKEVGSRLVVDHGAILDGIKRRDPAAARTAMERHLRTLADDLNQYWTESTSGAGSPESSVEPTTARPGTG